MCPISNYVLSYQILKRVDMAAILHSVYLTTNLKIILTYFPTTRSSHDSSPAALPKSRQQHTPNFIFLPHLIYSNPIFTQKQFSQRPRQNKKEVKEKSRWPFKCRGMTNRYVRNLVAGVKSGRVLPKIEFKCTATARLCVH